MVSKVSIKKGFMEILISTETGTLPVKVTNAKVNEKDTKVLGGKILLENINEIDNYFISFDLDNKDDWALEVNIYES